MSNPKFNLLSLWEECFEIQQEKAALYGDPVLQFNPYCVNDGDQAGVYCQQSLHERPPLGSPEPLPAPFGRSAVAPVILDD